MSRAPDVPRFNDPQDPLRAKACFAERGFTDAEVLAKLQLSELGELKEGDVAGLVERTSGGSPLETLIRLFLVGTRVAPAAAAEALAPLDLATWVAAGLVVLGVVILTLVCIVRGLDGERFKIPVLGELVDRL